MHWWGIELDLNSYWTSKLVNFINFGAGAAAFVAALEAFGVITAPSAAVSLVISGILWMGAAAIGFCSNSRGVKLFIVSVGPVFVTPWCSGQ
jgi:hypothetical protein